MLKYNIQPAIVDCNSKSESLEVYSLKSFESNDIYSWAVMPARYRIFWKTVLEMPAGNFFHWKQMLAHFSWSVKVKINLQPIHMISILNSFSFVIYCLHWSLGYAADLTSKLPYVSCPSVKHFGAVTCNENHYRRKCGSGYYFNGENCSTTPAGKSIRVCVWGNVQCLMLNGWVVYFSNGTRILYHGCRHHGHLFRMSTIYLLCSWQCLL